MKKIILLFTIFCCSKFMLYAQQISNNLTLLTTDLMSGEEKSNFNWRNLSYTKPAQRFFFPPPIYITAEPDDGVGGGGSGTVACPCPSGCTGETIKVADGNGGTKTCFICKGGNGKDWRCPPDPSNGGSLGSGTNLPPIIIIGAGWGSLLWGNLGNYFTTGFLNPPSYVPSGGSYSSGYIGGGGSAPPPPTGPSYPPPDKPVDDPHGGTNNPQKKDTLLPTPFPCSDTANRIGDSLTNLMINHIDTSAFMKKLRDSSNLRTKEAGFSIEAHGSQQPYQIVPLFYNDSGKTQQVELKFTSNTIANIHLHTFKNDSGNLIVESPSAADIFALLDNIIYPKRKKFFAMFTVYGGDSKQQYAIATSDTNKVNFFTQNNSIYQYVDTSQGHQYSNNWLGKIDSSNTYLGMFQKAINKFQKEGYPKEKLNTYAFVYMLRQLEIPLKLYTRNSQGLFKELNFTTKDVVVNGVKEEHFIITICN